MPDDPWSRDLPPYTVMDSPRAGVLEAGTLVVQKYLDEAGLRGVRALLSRRLVARLPEQSAITLRATIYGHQHPPQTITQTVTVPRLASPWQHFKARYRERWWMWVVRDFGFMKTLRYTDEPVPVTVEVRARTTYPHAVLPTPPPSLGEPVLYHEQSPLSSPWEPDVENRPL